MYYRALEKCKIQSLARSSGNFDRKVLTIFDRTVFSDASLKGWEGTDKVTELEVEGIA